MIDLERTLQQRFPHWFSGRRAGLTRPLVRGLAQFSRIAEIEQFLDRHRHLSGFGFIEAALARLDCRWLVDHVERERVPQSGRVVIVANHPLGAVDSLALLAFVGSVRRDVRILANDLLWAVEPLRDLMIPLRILGGKPSAESLAEVDAALAREEAVIFFPSGEVSRASPRGIHDGRWRPGFLRFAEQAGAPVLPVRIQGRNSAFFHGMSALYRPLGTALLPREMFSRHPRRIELRVGIARDPGELLREAGNLGRAIALVRRSLQAIGSRGESWGQAPVPLIHAPDARAVLAEVNRLPLLGQTACGKRIHAGRLGADSPLLREIARLRELTFRAVGEGTGQRLDSDEYDTWYEHIVLWDAASCELAGAYRAAPCARILGERGLSGLYTSGHFEFDARLLPLLERGVELGRSFVAPRYWGSRSLDWLWVGIGAWLRTRPEVRYLFGAVSISAAVPRAAREQMVAYYSRYYGDLHGYARPRKPFRYDGAPPEFGTLDASASLAVLRDNLSRLGAQVPMLYKQYTELCEPGGASFLSFGVDPLFSDSVDGLILVDLAQVKPRKRQRYLECRIDPPSIRQASAAGAALAATTDIATTFPVPMHQLRPDVAGAALP
jgi:putative hemolysin